jgi:hypothetical protein
MVVRHDLFDRLRALRLPAGDFVVFGSGPLVVRGIIEASNDLDVVCRGPAWRAVCALSPPKPSPWGVELVSLDDGRLTFGTRWAIGEVDTDELIDTAEIIDGLPFARLEHVIAYKRHSGRPKDLAHLDALERAADDR